MTDRDLIAEGRAVDAAATPGPWYACVNDLIGGKCVQVVDTPASETPPGNHVVDMVFRDADAEHIVWMRNNLRAVLDELKAARAAYTKLAQDTQADYAAIARRQQQYRDRIAELENRPQL